jgi:hypothetical protein
MNKNSSSLRGCTMYAWTHAPAEGRFGELLAVPARYTALFPNNESAKLIIQAGITAVLFYSDRVSACAAVLGARGAGFV